MRKWTKRLYGINESEAKLKAVGIAHKGEYFIPLNKRHLKDKENPTMFDIAGGLAKSLELHCEEAPEDLYRIINLIAVSFGWRLDSD